MNKRRRFTARKPFLIFIVGFLFAIILVFSGSKAYEATSTDRFCASCHNVHPHAIASWKLSTHYDNKRGIVVHCIDCHLPPSGLYKFSEKVQTGLRDVYGTLFKDVSKINWEEKSQLEHAVHHTYKTSCIACHQNLFPLGLTKEGEEAHLYYDRNPDDLHCINCHLGVGHFSENTIHAKNVGFGITAEADTIYDNAANLTGFEDFSEQIPGTGVSFDMIAMQGGSFLMGSPAEEKMRDSDEGPQVNVELSPFYIGKLEVSWDEYLTFFSETSSEGRMSEEELSKKQLDGITGPTPPWGAPDQGWGKGKMPAMSMSHYAATVYCEWLSKRTGKKYRLPTEAEWEYASRAGTQGAYFFNGTASDYSDKGLMKKIFGVDTTTINTYVIYEQNSQGKTAGPGSVLPNPFGLKNTLGNVAEFCSDYYQENAFSIYTDGIKDPKGPEEGEEYVVKGGSYKSDGSGVRCASREPTQTKAWLNTDPQMPKSKWWYSDQNYVGFRVVCE